MRNSTAASSDGRPDRSTVTEQGRAPRFTDPQAVFTDFQPTGHMVVSTRSHPGDPRIEGGTMKRSLVALVLTAVVAPSAQAMHAPTEVGNNSSRTFGNDAAARHHHPDVLQPPTRIVAVAGSDSFDWGDAGIGAVGALGATMLVGGSAVLLARDRRGTVSDPAGDLGR
jgi:hypothetical protein